MTQTIEHYPDDIDSLKALLLEKDQRISEQSQSINALQEQILELLAHRFGSSSERLSVEGQANLFDEAETQDNDSESDSAPTTVRSHQRTSRGKRAPLPPALPRVDVVHELSEDQRICPHDGTALRRIGEKVSEELNIVPMKVEVLRHIRPTYACPCCQKYLVTATKPEKLLPKSQASASTLAFIATSKYVDAMPLYRVSQMLARTQVHWPRQTLAHWMIKCGFGVQPLINRCDETLREGDLIFMDETRVQVLKEAGKSAESQSQMWVRAGGDEHGRPIRLFTYDPTRSSDVPLALLEGFRGALCTDGYGGYNRAVKDYALTHLHCWSHARRKFIDGLKQLNINPKRIPSPVPSKARRLVHGLGRIQKLYAIERRIKDYSCEQRLRVRQNESLPILEEFKQWVNETRMKVTPTSGIGRALTYVTNQWPGLIRYVEDGRWPIDNNRVENAIRPFVVGRKGWLFSDSVSGAKASANLYSLVETAKANGHEPYEYLRVVFERLPLAKSIDDIDALLPWTLPTATSFVERLQQSLLTVILSDGINMGLTRMAQACLGSSFKQLSWTADWYVTEEAYSRSLAELVNHHHRLALVKHWGDGTTASSDGQQFPLGSVARPLGEVNPKYGSRPGVIFYTHVSDQYSPFHTKLINTNTRDATYVLDGLLYHRSELEIDEHYTDTAGFTDHVFGLCHLLGFRFAPRLRDMGDLSLFATGDTHRWPRFERLFGRRIRTREIETQWDDILRLASSIRLGTVTASLIIRKLASYPRQNRLALAMREFGRIERTLFMLDWMRDPALRARVQAGLNKGEARNALARAVFFNRLGEVRDRSFENQSYRASGLNLVVAAIVLWNTVYLEQAVAAVRATRSVPEDYLAYLSPLGWEHVGLTGDYVWRLGP